MTRKRPPEAHVLSGVSLLITIFAILIALVVPAQLRGAGQPSAKATVVPTRQDASLPPFLPPVAYSAGGGVTESVAVADVNGDRKPDLVVAIQNDPAGTHQSNGLVGILLGNGDGTFQAPLIYDSGGNDPYSLAVADVNGDGKPDIVVANFCVWVGNTCSYATVGVLLGNGDGTFQPAVTYNVGATSATSVAIADVNGDGKPDLIIADLGNQVGVLLGNGDGTFQPAVLCGTGVGPYSVAVADLNGDGQPDLVLAGSLYSSGGGLSMGVVGVLLGNGDGTFQPALTYNSGVSPGGWANSVAVADVNRDGKPDLVVANFPDSTVGVLLGNGDGTFQTVALYGSGAQFAWSVAIADVNGDGNSDLIVADFNGTVGVLLGKGNGTFHPAITNNVQGDATSVVAADVNGDDKPDLLVTNGNTLVSVLLNDTSFCTTPPKVMLSTTPTILWPPNGRMVQVTVSGTTTNAGCTVTGAAYAVTDEYGKVQPSGAVTLGAGGAYSFTVLLQASRLGTDLDGRLYTIRVSASNNAGKMGSQAGSVIVPHDHGH